MAQGASCDGYCHVHIRAVVFTSSRDGDSPVLPELLDKSRGTKRSAPVSLRTRTAPMTPAAGHTAIIPMRKNGRPWMADCPAARARNETLRATRHYGRAFWKR